MRWLLLVVRRQTQMHHRSAALKRSQRLGRSLLQGLQLVLLTWLLVHRIRQMRRCCCWVRLRQTPAQTLLPQTQGWRRYRMLVLMLQQGRQSQSQSS